MDGIALYLNWAVSYLNDPYDICAGDPMTKNYTYTLYLCQFPGFDIAL